ncbi:MAG: acetyl-CoA carboxylase carboxyltransferase subunit beta [Candidatus Omnitrophica bacterium]|nr:acetyl-CoA carboxylase carboxyltransferase subunit beta [Candidatus Omnitrophota bacterium]
MRIFNKPLQGFGKKKRKKDMPDGLWSKCPKCSNAIFHKVLQDSLNVCPKCEYHFPLNCWERVDLLADKGTFAEFAADLESRDPINFAGPKTYPEKIAADKKKTGLKDAAIVGEAVISSRPCVLGITDYRFIMGSMGSVVGEKVTRLIEKGLEKRVPVIMVSGSGGGARMYEGLLSLMQMAKTSGALNRLKENNVAFVSVLTHPTMAGIMASFAGLGDITIAEPGALIGFTGPRVIKQTIKQDLPKGFQTSEFNLEHGLIDMVVHRKDLKEKLAGLMDYLT